MITLLVVGLLAFMVWASACVGSGVYVKTLCHNPHSDAVAITFDDGPDADSTPRVLNVLAAHGVKATFFVVGSKVEACPELAREIVRAGHTIANHSQSHSSTLPLKSAQEIGAEFRASKQVIKRITGVDVRLARPPFGVTNPNVGKAFRQAGYVTIGWSVRSFDTVSSLSRECIVRRVLRQTRAGDVVLLHDRCPDADKVLDAVLCGLERRGYKFCPIDKLFDIEPYEN